MTMGKLSRKVDDLDSLRFMMNLLKEARERESSIEMDINPIMDMYLMLEYYLPPGFMEKEEIDKKTVLRSNWKKLASLAQTRTDELSKTQIGFKRGLINDIAAFKTDIVQVRQRMAHPAAHVLPPFISSLTITTFHTNAIKSRPCFPLHSD